jgi:Tfp pilus assembly protein PilN
MLNYFKDKDILKSNKVLGVHCIVRPEGDMQFFYVLISRNKGKVDIDKFDTHIGKPESLVKEVTAEVPVLLSIDGKGVLSKKVSSDPLKSPVYQVIPNAAEEDFAFQLLEGEGNYSFVSLARINVVDELLADIVHQKFQVIGLSIGPFKAARLTSVFEDLPQNLRVNQYIISTDETSHKIQDFKKLEDMESLEIYKIGDKDLPSDYILPFSNALSYYLPDGNDLNYPAVSLQFEEYTSKRLFTIAGWASLLLLFAALVINMLMFTSYRNQKQMLDTQVTGDKELLANLTKLKEDLAWKEKFLSQTGILKNSSMAYYADQIAFSLPGAITLEKMEIHPIVSKIKKQKEIELLPNKIAIEGLSPGSQFINDWATRLKGLVWVDDVAVVNYFKEENASTGIFSLEIKIKGEKR